MTKRSVDDLRMMLILERRKLKAHKKAVRTFLNGIGKDFYVYEIDAEYKRVLKEMVK